MPSSTAEPGAPVEIGLSLGSNIGDGPANIAAALRHLEEGGAVEITAVSSIYKTAPWGYRDQPPFANACALGRTCLSPKALLAAVKKVEADMGRKETVRWGPRLIDIDILFYGEEPLNSEDLVLPHKELFNRAFVLVPLAEIAPDLRLAGRSIAEAARALAGNGIEKWPGR
ncbi:MAG TPA: 2-amino-4-hydroxy-6-hydroxymethyldihydropteridine diphosphokinase [Methylovirgula sp.]|nr:2-amino-4-hydroxy-6-hydroxymethyldihydropteridine diphosphokinase [Methylovirgula sp.]